MPVIVTGIVALNRRLNAVKKSPDPILREIQRQTIEGAKRTVHRKTGFTARSIRAGMVGGEVAYVHAGGAAVYLEFGTKPHRIPKSGNAKRPMPIGGARRLSGAVRRGSSPAGFAWHVNHPGTKPYPFLIPAAKQALADHGWKDVPVKQWNGAA